MGVECSSSAKWSSKVPRCCGSRLVEDEGRVSQGSSAAVPPSGRARCQDVVDRDLLKTKDVFHKPRVQGWHMAD
jgi:hypothetical protein